MSRFFSLLLLAAWLLPAFVQGAAAAESYMAQYKTKGDFDEVKDDVAFAITGRGLVINNVSHIGSMLARTGKAMGNSKAIFVKAQALEFCSATLSRDMMEADPHNIVFCPFIIAIYVLPDDPKTVYVSYRRPDLVGSPQSVAALRAVDRLLDGIVKEALQ
jgi:uncharacterized protein (DUF302 family)